VREKARDHAQLDGAWGEGGRDFCALADDGLPQLPPAEQGLYLRLVRLSHARRSPFAKCRSEDLAPPCGLSLRPLQRALPGRKHKPLLKTVWQSPGATTFTASVVSQLRHRPACLPRKRLSGELSPPPSAMTKPPVFDAFRPADRALLLTCKRGLSPEQVNELTEAAVDWLAEQAAGEPTAFADAVLRDKVDELVFREVFGVERRERYQSLFAHLYR
jgi:hypothetical protein